MIIAKILLVGMMIIWILFLRRIIIDAIANYKKPIFPKGERKFADNCEWHKAQAMLRWKNGTLLSEADREIAEEGFKDLENVKKPWFMQEQERNKFKEIGGNKKMTREEFDRDIAIDPEEEME